MKTPRLPRYVGGDFTTYVNDLVVQIERALAQVPSGRPYTVTNPVPTRTLNVSTATATDVAKVVGTMIADLQTGSSLG